MKIIAVLFPVVVTSCIPRIARKNDPFADVAPTSAASAEKKQEKVAAITIVDKNIFKLALPEEYVWESVMATLLKNYTLNIADKNNGLVSTEWDTYFSKQQTLRNKVTVRLRKLGPKTTEMTVRNQTEKLMDAQTVGGGVGVVWLPADDKGTEVERLIKSVSLALDQTPPVSPIEDVARSLQDTDSSMEKGDPAPSNY